MGKTQQPVPVLLAGLVVMRADGSRDVVEIGPASNLLVEMHRRWWQRRTHLVITFPDQTKPARVTYTPPGILATAPATMPDLPVDTTDTRYEDATRLNVA